MKEDKPSKLRITIDRIKLKAFEAGFLAGRKSEGRTEIALRNAYLKFDAAETAKLDRVADHFAIAAPVKIDKIKTDLIEEIQKAPHTWEDAIDVIRDF